MLLQLGIIALSILYSPGDCIDSEEGKDYIHPKHEVNAHLNTSKVEGLHTTIELEEKSGTFLEEKKI